MPGPPHHPHVPRSAVASFIDRARIEELLAPWVPNSAERAFVVRCMLDEGPTHHCGANYVLLALLGELASRAGGAAGAPPPAAEETVPVPMRLPPHLATGVVDGAYPLRFPRKVLDALGRDEPARQAMIDCLTDGPPQHALANAAMLCLLSALLDRPGGAVR